MKQSPATDLGAVQPALRFVKEAALENGLKDVLGVHLAPEVAVVLRVVACGAVRCGRVACEGRPWAYVTMALRQGRRTRTSSQVAKAAGKVGAGRDVNLANLRYEQGGGAWFTRRRDGGTERRRE